MELVATILDNAGLQFVYKQLTSSQILFKQVKNPEEVYDQQELSKRSRQQAGYQIHMKKN